MKLEGVHHVTCITGDAPQNVEYYTGVLGLRLVKKSVNQDDPTVYHLFYADEKGDAGSDITFFEYPGAAPGRAGNGMVHTVVWRVGSSEALDFWAARADGDRDGDVVRFVDPEGLHHELVIASVPDEPLIAEHPEIPRELALQGFEGVRAYSRDDGATSAAFLEKLGFERQDGAAFETRGELRGGWIALRRAACRARHPGRGHRPPCRVGVDDGAAGGVAEARRRGGRPADADHRPLLVPVDLLPRAERRPLRDRHARAGLRHGRGHGASRREADPAARLRAPARAGRAAADAAAGSAGELDAHVSLTALERPATGEPEGALVLLHGRGADEHDLFPLLDALDPRQRLHGYTPRAPLALPPGGAHWYIVPRVGFPDHDTFHASYELLSDWLEALPFPPEQIVLGGFSQGAVMAYSLGLGTGRPRPSSLLALSGFIPTVDGWEPDLEPPFPPIAIAHGSYDPVIPVEFAREAKELLERAGADVLYRESPIEHSIDPRVIVELRELVAPALR